ncbi:hypothetical protein VNO78_10257 [Psophocarpus tetragonolobus]|uniref:Uncharacterized protein n=1 Tax=Psophocarpus tetragonolobus TaxID=3891 RepID=A0AAN9XMT2_PSOTE
MKEISVRQLVKEFSGVGRNNRGHEKDCYERSGHMGRTCEGILLGQSSARDRPVDEIITRAGEGVIKKNQVVNGLVGQGENWELLSDVNTESRGRNAEKIGVVKVDEEMGVVSKASNSNDARRESCSAKS